MGANKTEDYEQREHPNSSGPLKQREITGIQAVTFRWAAQAADAGVPRVAPDSGRCRELRSDPPLSRGSRPGGRGGGGGSYS